MKADGQMVIVHELSELRAVRDELRHYLESRRLPADVTYALLTCVHEACTNALRHAGADKPVVLKLTTAAGKVQLKPGQRAKFVVRSVDASIAGSGCSTSWKTAQVQVYPPNQTISIRQPSTISACDLSVGPVSAA